MVRENVTWEEEWVVFPPPRLLRLRCPLNYPPYTANSRNFPGQQGRLNSELLTWYARKVSAFCFRIAGLQPRSAFEAGFPETSCWSGSAPRKGIRRLATDGQNSAGLA